jgi:hypothetical protein
LLSSASGQFFSAAGASIDKPVSLQVAENIVINIDMSALVINLIIPMQAEALQGFQDSIGGAFYVSWSVEVVNAQPPAALL